MSDKQLNQMRSEWDEIATINSHFGVDSCIEFEKDDIDEKLFFNRGKDAVERFLRILKLGDTSILKMVEIGCGLGRMTHHFAKKFDEVFAFDISPKMIKSAKKNLSGLNNVKLVLGSGCDLNPIQNDSIDLVFSFIVLQHVVDPNIVLNYIRESGRVLKNGGTAFLQFSAYIPDPIPNRSFLNMLKGLVPPIVKGPLKRLIGKHKPKHKSQKADPKNLEEQFMRDYSVWRGCKVNLVDVELSTRECNLQIDTIRGINTQYTFFTLKKCKSYQDRFV